VIGRALVVAVALAVVAGRGTAALGQSTRYPPPAPDPDAEAEARSDFWDRATLPGIDRYREKVDRARRLIEARSSDHLQSAEQLLVEATALLPRRTEALWYLGVAQELRGRWIECAASYRRVWQLDPSFTPPDTLRGRGPLGHALGICLARAGDLAEAAAHLERLTRVADVSADVLLRLGEVYLAMGRLADAIEVLERASDLATTAADVHWTLAVAYDRARRPADAARVAQLALTLDSALVRVAAPVMPYVPSEDLHYFVAFAHDAKDEPERAILYFREFVRVAPKGPWRQRAVEHLSALEAADLASRAVIQGTAPVDRKAVVATVRAGAGALGRCVAAIPGALLYVRVVQVGPRTATRAGELRLASAQPGVRASIFAAFGVEDEPLGQAAACVEREAARLRFPRPTAADSWSSISFPVIAR
jgi:tetratricopeptide (TPR) repeat protein